MLLNGGVDDKVVIVLVKAGLVFVFSFIDKLIVLSCCNSVIICISL